MKNMVKLGLSLAAFAVAACVLLAVVNNFTQPLIEKTKAAAAAAGLIDVFSDADNFEVAAAFTPDMATSVQVESLYLAKKDGTVVGAVVQATGPTYDKATILLGIDLNRTITGIKFMAISDTPGYGQNATKPDFYTQFAGKSANDAFEAGQDVQAISGATITTKGVSQIVKYASYAAGEFLAANYGGASGTGAAPVIAKKATLFTYQTATESLFSADSYGDVVFTENDEDLNRIVKNMLIEKQLIASVDGKQVGVLVAARGQTYHDGGVVLTAVDMRGTIIGARIIELADTPSIGMRAIEESFYGQFAGKSAAGSLLSGEDYDTISGASITADCVADIIKVGATEAAKIAAALGGAAFSANGDYPLNEHYLEE